MKIPKTSFSGYGALLKESWRSLWQLPMTFLPAVYTYLGMLVIGLGLTGVARLAYGGLETVDIKTGSIVAFVALGIIVAFLFGTHVAAVYASVFRRAARGKPITISEVFRDAAGLFRRSAGMVLAVIVASLPLLLLVGVTVGVMAVAATKPVLFVLVGFLALVFLLVFFGYGAWLVFLLPLLAYTKLGAWRMLGQAWALLWRDNSHVWVTYLIHFGIGVGVGVALGGVSVALSLLSSGEEPLWWTIISFLVNIVVAVWLLLFVFRSFIARYKPKVS
ncbi:hypothetical protein GF367_04815 [Candidatus Woesearchaeota archaeon]|nr:hypothetical protein [Candidatus Woesearchaeota archaeon]